MCQILNSLIVSLESDPKLHQHQTSMDANSLRVLNQGPLRVDCPICGAREVTKNKFVASCSTQYIPIFICFNKQVALQYFPVYVPVSLDVIFIMKLKLKMLNIDVESVIYYW